MLASCSSTKSIYCLYFRFVPKSPRCRATETEKNNMKKYINWLLHTKVVPQQQTCPLAMKTYRHTRARPRTNTHAHTHTHTHTHTNTHTHTHTRARTHTHTQTYTHTHTHTHTHIHTDAGSSTSTSTPSQPMSESKATCKGRQCCGACICQCTDQYLGLIGARGPWLLCGPCPGPQHHPRCFQATIPQSSSCGHHVTLC